MNKDLITEYFEDSVEEMGVPDVRESVVVIRPPEDEGGGIVFFEDEFEIEGEEAFIDPSDFVISFSEDLEGDFEDDDTEDFDVEIVEFEEDLFEDEEGGEEDEQEDEDEDEDEDDEDDMENEVADVMPSVPQMSSREMNTDLPGDVSDDLETPISEPSHRDVLPGSDFSLDDTSEDDTRETNWIKDRDPSKFIFYLRDAWNDIPRHDGNTISGCERALTYLTKLNKEISEAVRKDEDDALTDHLQEIEDFRVRIIQGVVKLKNRIGDLKKKIREEGSQQKRSATVNELLKSSLLSSENFKKKAATPNIQLVITPFERAITGILINSVVSAGNPFEDVYEYLKDKFELTDREELAILQLIMDMGFPVFKDRGTIGGDSEGEDSEDGKRGLDFIKTYFA